MAYNQQLADRVRERFAEFPEVEEKSMMGGLTFMYNGKMCVGVFKDELMCRIDPDVYEAVLEKKGCRAMEFGGKVMTGYVLVSEEGIRLKKDFEYWIGLALEYNPRARASKGKK